MESVNISGLTISGNVNLSATTGGTTETVKIGKLEPAIYQGGDPNLQDVTKNYTPTESAQSEAIQASQDYDGLGTVTVNVGAISSSYVGSGITRRSSSDLSASGATVTAPAGYYSSNATKSVQAGSATTPATTITANPSISVGSDGKITATVNKSQNVTPTVSAGYVSSGTAGAIGVTGSTTSQLSTQAGTTISPTESEQTAVASGKYTTGVVKVGAISSTYVGSNVPRRDSNDIEIGSNWFVVPYGYYDTDGGGTIAFGTAGTPTATKSAVSNHALTVTPSVTNVAGYIISETKTGTAVSVSASELCSGTKSITQNGTGIDVVGYASVNVSVGGGAPTLQTKTKSYTPTETAQSEDIEPDTGYDGLSKVSVSVGAISSSYVGSGITRRSSSDLTESSGTITAPAGYYASSASKAVSAMTLPTATSSSSSGTRKLTIDASTTGANLYLNIPTGYNSSAAYYQINAVASGSVSNPVATKGTVSNHSVSVTPSVSSTTGYITGGTKTGTAVTVQASELVSGNLAITQNGNNIDCSTYSTVSVNVSGGGGSGLSVSSATATPSSAGASISFTGLTAEPSSFYVISNANLATGASPYKTAAVVFDGTNLHGQIVTNTSNANASYNTGFSKSYSNGTLTITGTGAYFQANQYTLIYTTGGSSANIGTANVQVGSGATSITFTDLPDEPTCWSCIFKSDFGTSSGYSRVIAVVNDGSSIYGMEMSSGANATSNWSASYSNGSLTISSTSTSAGGYFHQPGYYQLTYAVGGTIEITTEPLSVTENGTYTAPSGKAYTPVTVNVSGGGGWAIDSKTISNSSNTATSISFTSMKGQPRAFFLRCTTQMQSSSTTYYYVSNMRYDGTDTEGNAFRMGSTRQVTVVTSGYSWSYSGTTLTLSSSGNRTTAPGSFYNGNFELTYIY